MANKSISVAMATCNGAAYLMPQLMDLRGQNHLPAEVVVCDDASSDGTASLIEDFAKNAPFPVRVYRNPIRLGYRANFIHCASLCRSEVIAFCDQDDRWRSDKLALIAQAFDDPGTLLVYHNALVVDADEQPVRQLYATGTKPLATSPQSESPWDSPLGFTQAFRRGLLDFNTFWPISQDHNFPDEPMAHDQWYHFLATSMGRVTYLPEMLASYRQHGSNVFGWRRSVGRPLLTRVSVKIAEGERIIAHRARSAQRRAIVLEQIAEGLDRPKRDRALKVAASYRGMARRTELRAALYSTPRFMGRINLLGRMLWDRAYGSDPWRLGVMALAMDLTVGLLALRPRPAAGAAADMQKPAAPAQRH